MFEFDFPWAFAFLLGPLFVWWLLPPYRERQEAVRIPHFEQVAAAAGQRPATGGVVMRRNVLQGMIAPLAWILLFVSLLLNGALFASFLSATSDVTASLEYVFGGNLFFWVLTLLLALS